MEQNETIIKKDKQQAPYMEKNIAMNESNTSQNTSKHAHLVFQDLPHIAPSRGLFPPCKTAKVGNLFYPVIANDNLMEFIASDDNLVEAARKVKGNAFNPSGSEHGIVKKACDMFIDNPSFRNIICQDLIQGIYSPERIASSPVFKANYMTLPRGFKYTINQIVQTMILEVIKASNMSKCMMPYAWGKTSNLSVNAMIESVDQIRAKGFKCWVSFNMKSLFEKIPHDRLMQKIHIMFQDKRLAVLICTLLELHESTTDGNKRTKCVGIPKDSPLSAMLGYELYLSELDQEIMRFGLTHVRYDGEIVVFCDTYAGAKQIKSDLSDFAKKTLGCPFDYRRTTIKDIAHLAFLGLELQGGRWCIQYKVKNAAASDYVIDIIIYSRLKEDSQLWEAYRKMTSFINFYEGVYALRNEILRLKKWRDEHFTNAIILVEKAKLGLIKIPQK